MRYLMLLPTLVLAACSAVNEDASNVQKNDREYATQLDAPSPDYARLISNAQKIESAEILRDPTAPPPANARELGELWLTRLEERGAVMGHGLDGKGPESAIQSIDTLLTAEDFDAWVAENDWSVPPHLRWSFRLPLIAPQVSESALGGVRLWPASQMRTGWQLEAAFGGKIYLREGCIFMQGQQENASEKLAWFHAETGLDLDAEGYYVLINRTTGQIAARLGEKMTWAGPNAVDVNDPAVVAYREACGGHEIEGVGNPEANERIYQSYPQLRQSPDALPPPGIE
ncbi:MAG: hypothetical protein P1U62_04800 [Alteraurantiacibacter sp. bin_em_oilr2.035]|nr:hypothetical protein [Alteraurantiacibacter sp. bin_em_oilr2.035]